jgi:tetratricopeptide (TPR) repeat protein
MILSMRALEKHGLQPGMLLIALVSLREPVGAEDPSQTDQAKLSSFQQKIDNLDRAGEYREAIPLAQDALKLVESTVGSERPETAAACDRLGELYRKNGDYAKAKPLCERKLEIREKVLGPDEPHTAQSLNNVALLYYYMDDFAKAEPLYQRAFKIREKALGPEHPDTAESLNNLAQLYRKVATTSRRNRCINAHSRSARKRSGRSIPIPQKASTIWHCFILEWVTLKKHCALPCWLGGLKKKSVRDFVLYL